MTRRLFRKPVPRSPTAAGMHHRDGLASRAASGSRLTTVRNGLRVSLDFTEFDALLDRVFDVESWSQLFGE